MMRNKLACPKLIRKIGAYSIPISYRGARVHDTPTSILKNKCVLQPFTWLVPRLKRFRHTWHFPLGTFPVLRASSHILPPSTGSIAKLFALIIHGLSPTIPEWLRACCCFTCDAEVIKILQRVIQGVWLNAYLTHCVLALQPRTARIYWLSHLHARSNLKGNSRTALQGVRD